MERQFLLSPDTLSDIYESSQTYARISVSENNRMIISFGGGKPDRDGRDRILSAISELLENAGFDLTKPFRAFRDVANFNTLFTQP